MVLKLYGLAMASGTTYAVAVTLHEKKIPFEIVPIDLLNLYNGYRTPELLAIQPFHQIPAIDDDGFVLYESRAICRYLAEKYPDQGTSLLPTERKAKALFEQAASIEYSNFHPHAFVIYVEGRQKAIKDLEKDQAKFDDAVSKLSAVLQVYETILGKQKYLAGDEFTLADLFHISFGTLLEPSGCDLMTSTGPNVARWWKEILGRPSLSTLERGTTITSVGSC
ncbi:glutathione S-transferase [Mycena albidolilacea]|uniref:glutathione transferase n=1 Tax=Mycena albidolilacea TaxID=1033008 RepID=A0AAD6ZET6_9AGAR|nr:glutathione S-transferase [Mycena albidolilacea]